MNIGNLWNLQGQLVLLLMFGAILRKIGMIHKEAKTFLTDFVLFVALPCNIIVSFPIEYSPSLLFSFLLILLISLFIQVFCLFIGKILFRNQIQERRSALRYGILVSNAAFVGLPLVAEVFGESGLILASIYLIPQRIMMWTAGLVCFSKNEQSLKQKMRNIALHPCIVAVYIGLFIMFSGIALPEFIFKTLKSVSLCTTPLSMMFIGALLAEMDKNNVNIDWTLSFFAFIRLFFIPSITYVACKLFSINLLITGVSVLLAAMPGGSSTAILASKYNGDALYASKMVTFSTLVSMVSIPLWYSILH